MGQMRKTAGGLSKRLVGKPLFPAPHPVGIPVTFEIDWMIGR